MSASEPVSSDEAAMRRQFENLVTEYSADMYRFAFWLGGEEQLARDVVQEACLRAWRSFSRLHDIHAGKAWLFTIIRREHARHFQRKRLPTSDIEDHEVADHTAWADPEQVGSDQEIRQAIERLPQNYREPLLMQVLGGMSCKEIADALEVKSGAVMTRLFRARQKLKVLLEEDSASNGGSDELR
ncbi:MAG: sigma-70 family RNA polymerase sigma factor [Rhodanobacteraceae bacterium]